MTKKREKTRKNEPPKNTVSVSTRKEGGAEYRDAQRDHTNECRRWLLSYLRQQPNKDAGVPVAKIPGSGRIKWRTVIAQFPRYFEVLQWRGEDRAKDKVRLHNDLRRFER